MFQEQPAGGKGPYTGAVAVAPNHTPAFTPGSEESERAARASLRAQIVRLEGELSAIVAERFPFVAAPGGARVSGPAIGGAKSSGPRGPRVQGIAELERCRDQLAAGLQEMSARAARRAEHERRARALLDAMKLEPGRYRYYRVPVRDLGEGTCGVWEVRPRLGLIGMLAGWWELKLSSGCPLERESRPRRGSAPFVPRSS